MALPQGPPAMPVPQVPPPTPVPMYPAPPRPDPSRIIVIVVLVVVAVVAVAVVLVAMLLVMMGGLVGVPDSPTPDVLLSSAESCGPDCWQVSVADASRPAALSLYTVVAETENGSFAAPLQPGLVMSRAEFTLTFQDQGQADELNAGDTFRFAKPAFGATCRLGLDWAPSGQRIVTTQWTC